MPLFLYKRYKWSKWYNFNNIDFIEDVIENKKGVWVVRYNKEILYIGYSKYLKKRIVKNFYLGKGKHSTRDRMKKDNINFNQLEFKFTYITEYKELKKTLLTKYEKFFKKLPKYVKKIT